MVYSPKELLAKVKPEIKLSSSQKAQVSDLVGKVMAALKENALECQRTEVDLIGNRWETHYDFQTYLPGIIITEAMNRLQKKGWEISYEPDQMNPDYGRVQGAHASIDRFYIKPKQKEEK
jgi:hypothetical protein